MQVDLFFYREPEEAKPQDEEETGAAADYGHADFSSAPALTSDQWPVQGVSDAQWNADAPSPISAIPWSAAPEPGRNKDTSFFCFCLLKCKIIKFYLMYVVRLTIFCMGWFYYCCKFLR